MRALGPVAAAVLCGVCATGCGPKVADGPRGQRLAHQGKKPATAPQVWHQGTLYIDAVHVVERRGFLQSDDDMSSSRTVKDRWIVAVDPATGAVRTYESWAAAGVIPGRVAPTPIPVAGFQSTPRSTTGIQEFHSVDGHISAQVKAPGDSTLEVLRDGETVFRWRTKGSSRRIDTGLFLGHNVIWRDSHGVVYAIDLAESKELHEFLGVAAWGFHRDGLLVVHRANETAFVAEHGLLRGLPRVLLGYNAITAKERLWVVQGNQLIALDLDTFERVVHPLPIAADALYWDSVNGSMLIFAYPGPEARLCTGTVPPDAWSCWALNLERNPGPARRYP